jgi:hypothetical protein
MEEPSGGGDTDRLCLRFSCLLCLLSLVDLSVLGIAWVIPDALPCAEVEVVYLVVCDIFDRLPTMWKRGTFRAV